MVTTKNLALVFGAVYLLVGILGFIPPLAPNGYLLGIFYIDTVHNIVHLLLGVLGIAAAYSGMARLYCQVVGVVLLLLAVLGFFLTGADGMFLGILHLNTADHLLHLVTGAILAYFGFMASERMTTVKA